MLYTFVLKKFSYVTLSVLLLTLYTLPDHKPDIEKVQSLAIYQNKTINFSISDTIPF